MNDKRKYYFAAVEVAMIAALSATSFFAVADGLFSTKDVTDYCSNQKDVTGC